MTDPGEDVHSTPIPSPPPEASDESNLRRLGYAQELLRAMGGFSSFALSFSIISVLTGIVTTFTDAISGGGPAALGIGWPLVSVGTLFVALAMAELASAFPTAGALYHWSALLGGPGWGWFTAMMNLIGQCAIVAAIDFGCAGVLAATLRLPSWAPIPLCAVILGSHAAFNVFSVRLVAWLNDFSATVHILGVVVLVALLFAIGRAHPFAYLATTGFTLREDGSYPLGFANALILGLFTFTGYDASAHMSEETHDPARRAPWGIVSSVVLSAVAGYAFVAALTLAIPARASGLADVAHDKYAALRIMHEALGQGAGSWAMGLAIAAMWFCGLSSVTSASRTLYAFSRDKGLPMATAFRRVSARYRTPHVAIGTAVVMPFLLVLATARFSDAVFTAIAQMATMGLYVSYATPIVLGAVARHRGAWNRMGPWRLGRFGVAVAWVAVLWSVGVLVVCALPPNGVSGVLLLGAVSGLGIFYFAVVRGRFAGPRITLAALEKGGR